MSVIRKILAAVEADSDARVALQNGFSISRILRSEVSERCLCPDLRLRVVFGIPCIATTGHSLSVNADIIVQSVVLESGGREVFTNTAWYLMRKSPVPVLPMNRWTRGAHSLSSRVMLSTRSRADVVNNCTHRQLQSSDGKSGQPRPGTAQ